MRKRVAGVIGVVGLLGAGLGACGGGEPGGASGGSSGGGGVGEALDPCEWCGAQDVPEGELGAVMTIAGPEEPGDRMVLRGRVVEGHGVTPAAGVLVYAYHTDATGVYRREGQETGNGRRHGVLRGWLRTDPLGRYEIRSIRPAAYPLRSEPAHVHITLEYPGGAEDWIEPTMYEGDELLTAALVEADAEEGRFGAVVALRADGDGVLVGERDLRPRP
ncbi:MAG: intradiol ring-cleavage dioxygenase [Phycisphaerales bacterium JB059]